MDLFINVSDLQFLYAIALRKVLLYAVKSSDLVIQFWYAGVDLMTRLIDHQNRHVCSDLTCSGT